jgi:signal transduction histidine kinase
MVNINPIPCGLRGFSRRKFVTPRKGLATAGKGHRGQTSFLVITFLLLMLSTATVAKAEKVIIVGGDQGYPPYEFLDQDGNPAGYNVELTRAIAEVMGIKVQIRLGDWDEMRQALANGSVDILEGMVYSKERAQRFDFSPPHSFVNESVFARKGVPPVTSLEQLHGKEVIVQRGGFSHDYLVNQHVGAKLILVETHREALRLLASGRGDYALVGNLPGLYLGRKLGLSNVVPVGKPFSGQPYGYAVKKGNEKILAQFSEGLALLKKTGRQQQIYDHWLGSLEPRGIPWKKIVLVGGMVFGPLLIILGGIVVWNRSLKQEVERRTRDLQLQQQQLIQADKMASLGILVSGVAHEINNPTGLILYNLPVLMKVYKVAQASLETRFQDEGDFMIGGLRYSTMREEVPRLFSEMQDGANRIKRIVEDLKDFARQETTDLTDSVDLNGVVQASVRLVDNSIKKATSHFAVRYAEGLPPFKGNAQRIEQVVVNLILNACQSLNDPEQGIFLRTLCDNLQREVILEVRDKGAGIPEEHLSHLTAPFFTTKREQGGTGLGLSVSAGIVEDHRGRLAFTSAPGRGTTVTLALPIQKEGNAP